jgi:hypothetical protein
VRGLAGISIDPGSGTPTVVWTVDDATSAFQTIIGPKDQRVLVVSNINPATEVTDPNRTEQVTWRNMMTGELLAQSEFVEPMSGGALLVPGYGGRIYFMSENGFIVYHVTTAPPTAAPMPTKAPTASP